VFLVRFSPLQFVKVLTELKMRNTKRDNTASRFCFGMELIGSKITLIFFEMLSKLNNLHRLLQTISFGSSNFF
jgi:hypothetical protein